MSWLQALLLGLVQGLTEFLPVSSSGHLMIFRELLGVDSEGFMDFTVMVHFATVLSTLVVFSKPVWRLQVPLQRPDRLCSEDSRLDGPGRRRRPVLQGQGRSSLR